MVLTEEEEQRLKDLFDQYDEDGSGHITEDELYTILNEILHNKATAIHIVHVSFLNKTQSTFPCLRFEELVHVLKNGYQCIAT